MENYKTRRTEEKQIHRGKKREYFNDQLKDIEKHNRERDHRKFYKKVNTSRKGFTPRAGLCMDDEGRLLTNKDDILNQWAGYFERLLQDRERNQTTQVLSQEIYNEDTYS